MALRENREYIMGGFGMNAFVDAAQQLDCPARYINDCFDASKLNAKFVKDPALRRATAVATRAVRAGEEILASYGEDYWRARGVDPATGLPGPMQVAPMPPIVGGGGRAVVQQH
jgi:hypothetical protein